MKSLFTFSNFLLARKLLGGHTFKFGLLAAAGIGAYKLFNAVREARPEIDAYLASKPDADSGRENQARA